MQQTQMKFLVLTILAEAICRQPALASTNVLDGRHTVLMSAPLESDRYWNPENKTGIFKTDDSGGLYEDVIDFQAKLAKSFMAAGLNVVISCDEAACGILKSKGMPGDILWSGGISGVYMRDFGRINPEKQAAYVFRPSHYSRKQDPAYIQGTYEVAIKNAGLEFGRLNQFLLEGGNVVGNLQGSAVVSSRFINENEEILCSGGMLNTTNTQLFEKECESVAIQLLKDETGYDDIAIIPELENTMTGHADLMVSFIDKNILAYNFFSPRVLDISGRIARISLVQALRKAFGVKYQLLPLIQRYPFRITRGVLDESGKEVTACGFYTNALYTGDKLFIPTFGDDIENRKDRLTKGWDNLIVGRIRRRTKAEVFTVPVPKKICEIGGGIRRFTWLLNGNDANVLVDYVAQRNQMRWRRLRQMQSSQQ